MLLQKRKLKRCPGTIIGHGPKPSAVVLYNRTANRQPHPHSLRLGGVESIKDLFEILCIESNTGVLHSYKHFIRFVRRGSNHHLPRSIRDRIHGFDTVYHQIENHLLQLDPIAQYAGKIDSQIHLQHDAGFLYFALRQTHNLLDDFVDIQKRLLGVAFFDQCADASDDIASAVAVSDNTRYRVTRLV